MVVALDMTDEIRAAVRAELKRREMTQTDLAQQIGVKPQYLSNMMAGSVSRMPQAWQNVLEALEMTLIAVPKGYKATITKDESNG